MLNDSRLKKNPEGQVEPLPGRYPTGCRKFYPETLSGKVFALSSEYLKCAAGFIG